ncbi:MAG: hypothetical protein K9I70_10220 [Chitinophagaceae bacterium]|nr:hypothetical protein [Chitinophagaceae bacterium]
MKQKILKKILSHSRKTKSIISARQFGDSSNQFVGYILDYDENIFIMQQVSVLGLEDGLLIESIDNIETFEMGEYEAAYQFLFENPTKLSNQTIKEIALPKTKNWKLDLLEKLFALNEIITIQLKSDNNTITGFVVSFDEMHLEFNPLSNLGRDEGIVIYKLDDISTFTINELDSRRIRTFKEWQNRKA